MKKFLLEKLVVFLKSWLLLITFPFWFSPQWLPWNSVCLWGELVALMHRQGQWGGRKTEKEEEEKRLRQREGYLGQLKAMILYFGLYENPKVFPVLCFLAEAKWNQRNYIHLQYFAKLLHFGFCRRLTFPHFLVQPGSSGKLSHPPASFMQPMYWLHLGTLMTMLFTFFSFFLTLSSLFISRIFLLLLLTCRIFVSTAGSVSGMWQMFSE